MSKQDRRKFIRLSVYHLAKYRLISDIGEKTAPLFAVIKNIAAGGACLRTEERLPLSATIELKINFPARSTPISTLAKVVWAKQIGKSGRFELGVQFIEIQESVRKFIEEQIKFVYKKVEKKKKIT